MSTIHATVNTRLLGKASRLFTGTLAGRIIEILQNARRAQAQHVEIHNRDGVVTVRDDGQGIEEFAKLLDLGGSSWQQVGGQRGPGRGGAVLPGTTRPLTIRSAGQRLTIDAEGWTGAPVQVKADPQPLPLCPDSISEGVGTELSFPDERWSLDAGRAADYVAPDANSQIKWLV